jgi:hypothetical protein
MVRIIGSKGTSQTAKVRTSKRNKNMDIINYVTCEASKLFRNKKREHLKEKK